MTNDKTTATPPPVTSADSDDVISSTIASLHAQITAKDQIIADMRNRIAYRDDQIVQLKMEAGRAAAMATCLRAQIIGLQNLHTEEKLDVLSKDLVHASVMRKQSGGDHD